MSDLFEAFHDGRLLVGDHPRKSGAQPPTRMVLIGRGDARDWHLETGTWSLIRIDAEWDMGEPSEDAIGRVANALDVHPEEVVLRKAFVWITGKE